MRFSFAWLVAANAVGLLLSLLLVWPDAGKLLGSLTYGRLMPLHMEWQLYGWCTLPLVGLLLKEFLGRDMAGISNAQYILFLWSLGLFVGGVTFLTGSASGKLFLSWHGWSRVFFPSMLLLIWSVLMLHWIRDRRNTDISRIRQIIRGIILLLLAIVPISLYYASSRSIYPPVNPHSGGATGHSLLASSLGILGLFGVVPAMLGRKRVTSIWFSVYWIAFASCCLVYLLIQHGSVANTNWDQIAGLGTLLVMVPVLVLYIKLWEWPRGSQPWVIVFLLWWALLTVSGWITFLPGFLDQLKFTNGLVAHAHLAMAGMITAFNFILLASISQDSVDEESKCFGGFSLFVAWNASCLVMVISLLIQGWREGGNPGVLFGQDFTTQAIYWIRALTGLVMLSVSLLWFLKASGFTIKKEIWSEK